jgi:predicted nucleotidyltransferase
MDKQVILEKLKADTEEIRRLFQVKRLSVFGSVARGEAGDDSDIDVLVAFEQRATFDLFMELKFYLEEILGTGVDLVTEKALRPEIRQAIEKEKIDVS